MAKKVKGKKSKSIKLNPSNVYLKELNIINAKGLENIQIELEKKGVTCITGLNGVGKSTVLHLLANAFSQSVEWMKVSPFLHNYRPNKAYSFPDFFETTKKNDWDGMQCEYKFSNNSIFRFHRKRSKNKERIYWPRYENRPNRPIFYTGLDYLATEIEIDSRQTPYILRRSKSPKKFNSSMKKEVLKWAEKIIGKKYKNLNFYKKSGGKVKNFIGVKDDNLSNVYTSYEMGAGERKIFYLLIWLSMIPRNSIVLIDEPEALLYSEATKKLFEFFVELSERKKLQIVCTTHWAGIRDFKEEIKLFILARDENKKVVKHEDMESVTFQSMHGEFPNKKLLLVEDTIAELIVQQVVNEEGKGSFYRFIKVGGKENIPTYIRILIEIRKKEFLAISDGDEPIRSWKKKADKSKNIHADDLKKKHISLLPKKVVGEDEAKLPEYVILKYGKDGLSGEGKSHIANCSLGSKEEVKERIYEIKSMYSGNEITPINDMIREFATNCRDKWEAYTKDVRAKIKADKF